jgi:hypothetical protein
VVVVAWVVVVVDVEAFVTCAGITGVTPLFLRIFCPALESRNFTKALAAASCGSRFRIATVY